MHKKYVRISLKFWFAWIFACAFAPCAGEIARTAFMRQKRPVDPDYMSLILIVIIIEAFVLPRIIEAAALRLFVPCLSFIQWTLSILSIYVSFAVIVIITIVDRIQDVLDKIFWYSDLRFKSALRQSILDKPDVMSAVFALPWSDWFVGNFVQTIFIYIVPILLLAHRSGLGGWRFLIAAYIGSLISSLVHVFALEIPNRSYALNGLSWELRTKTLIPMATRGAVWGAASGLALILLTRCWLSTDAVGGRGEMDAN